MHKILMQETVVKKLVDFIKYQRFLTRIDVHTHLPDDLLDTCIS
jgi:hypothetical protein